MATLLSTHARPFSLPPTRSRNASRGRRSPCNEARQSADPWRVNDRDRPRHKRFDAAPVADPAKRRRYSFPSRRAVADQTEVERTAGSQSATHSAQTAANNRLARDSRLDAHRDLCVEEPRSAELNSRSATFRPSPTLYTDETRHSQGSSGAFKSAGSTGLSQGVTPRNSPTKARLNRRATSAAHAHRRSEAAQWASRRHRTPYCSSLWQGGAAKSDRVRQSPFPFNCSLMKHRCHSVKLELRDAHFTSGRNSFRRAYGKFIATDPNARRTGTPHRRSRKKLIYLNNYRFRWGPDLRLADPLI